MLSLGGLSTAERESGGISAPASYSTKVKSGSDWNGVGERSFCAWMSSLSSIWGLTFVKLAMATGPWVVMKEEERVRRLISLLEMLLSSSTRDSSVS